jgi:hypothetical protein
VTDKVEAWWAGQNKLLLGVLSLTTAVMVVFMSGLWSNIADIKRDTAVSRQEVIDLLKVLPKEYVSMQLYQSEKASNERMQKDIGDTVKRIEIDMGILKQQTAVNTGKLNDVCVEIKEHIKLQSKGSERGKSY